LPTSERAELPLDWRKQPLHEVTKCASKKSVFFSKIKIGVFACFFAQT